MPEELEAIVRRAMHREPSARYESVAELVEAVDEFLLHRGSLELCDEADARFTELRVGFEGSTGSNARSDADVLFREARFAYERALREWPDNERAEAGRRALLIWMIGYEIRRGAPRVARGLLKLLADPPPALVREVDESVAAQLTREDRLAALEHDADRAVGRRQRVRRFIVAAALWAPTCFVCGYLTRSGVWPVSHARFGTIGAVFCAASVLSAIAIRQQMANAINRRIVLTSALVFGFGAIGWPVMGAIGISMPQATVVGAALTGSLWLTVIFHYGRVWIPMAFGNFVIAALAWLVPSHHFEVFGLSAIPVLITAWLMTREKPREAR